MYNFLSTLRLSDYINLIPFKEHKAFDESFLIYKLIPTKYKYKVVYIILHYFYSGILGQNRKKLYC